MPDFERPKPLRTNKQRPSEEPPQLRAFAAGAANAVAVPIDPPPEPLEAARAALPPELPRPKHGMNIRFDDDEKAALELLARADGRSQHSILKRLLRPVLLEAAARLKI